MEVRFTRHARSKFEILKQAGFPISRRQVLDCLLKPIKIEDRSDGTKIATMVISDDHVLRVVYRMSDDTMLVITFYPGRRRAYGF